MEQTLGKRIIENRKRLGLTQDKLAEQLGVTAQAVSKWENDQSCPDITMLPRLAEIFGSTTDALLGIEPQVTVHEAEVVTEEEPKGLRMDTDNGTWEFRYDAGRKNGIGIALWIILVGGLLLASNILGWGIAVWSILWPSGLLIFGLFGLYPKFSFFRLGCGLFGAYFLLTNLGFSIFAQATLGKEYILPIFLLLVGLSVLVGALRKKSQPHFQFSHNGKVIHDSKKNKFASHCEVEGEAFECSASFGTSNPVIRMPRLSSGEATIAFGELTVDLSECDEISEDCFIEANCSFGQLTFLVPKRWQVDPVTNSAFGAAEITGHPSPDAVGLIRMECNISFGGIEIKYI